MFKATQKIYDALNGRSGLKVFTEESEKSSEVWLQFGIKNGGSYRIKFISVDDDNDVALRVYGLIRTDEEHHFQILEALNTLNNKYRYVKFCCDKDGDVNIEFDFPVNCPDPSASAYELVARIVNIVDEAYPVLMRALWQ